MHQDDVPGLLCPTDVWGVHGGDRRLLVQSRGGRKHQM